MECSVEWLFSPTLQPGRVLSVRELPLPPLGRDDVLVRILAAPVNPADLNIIEGGVATYLSTGPI